MTAPLRTCSRAALAAAVCLAVAACGDGGDGFPAELRPDAARGFNLLVVTLDTTRADRLGCYGREGAETPVVDGLAAQGVRFADAVTPAPITLPSHATIFTGLLPNHHGARDNSEFRLEPENVTLAEVLAKEGYRTGAFVSAFVLDARFGLDQGFELYDDRMVPGAGIGDFNQRPAASTTTDAAEWLAEGPADRPFFLWVHYFDAHHPYDPPRPQRDRFADDLYAGEIAYVDAELGRLLEALDARGATERTVIVVVADHGEGLGEHGESTHGMLLHEAVMHVPLILAVPGLTRAGCVVDDVVVSTADIVPTVLELLGVADGTPRDGRSLLGAGRAGERSLYMEATAPYYESGWAPLFGLRGHADKFVLGPMPEYYRLERDPDERDNLYGRQEPELRQAYEARRAALEAIVGEDPVAGLESAARHPLDPATAAKLEALGYAAGVAPEARTGLADPKSMLSIMQAVSRSETLMMAGQLDESLAVLEEAEGRSPGHRRILLNKATVLAMLDRREEAKATIREFNAIRPSPDSLLLLAQLLIQDGALGEADALLDQAASLDPSHGGVFIARGDRLDLLGRPDEALAAYEKAREVDPSRVSEAAAARIAALRQRLGR